MDGGILLGLELTVVFAQENRKEPAEMRARERIRCVFGHPCFLLHQMLLCFCFAS
uniref:Uncharacterized protein n=1 Tax=Rhizophora mucronata TaxID=61149 RepID=A0A2P2L279_RHIMU